jgi:hypothetical protein
VTATSAAGKVQASHLTQDYPERASAASTTLWQDLAQTGFELSFLDVGGIRTRVLLKPDADMVHRERTGGSSPAAAPPTDAEEDT